MLFKYLMMYMHYNQGNLPEITQPTRSNMFDIEKTDFGVRFLDHV